MRFRFTPLVKKFSKFANRVVNDFILCAKGVKCLRKEFEGLATGYDYAIAYISHFSRLKRKSILFQKQYTVDFGTGPTKLYVAFSKKDASRSRAEFVIDGVLDKHRDELISLLNVFLDKIRCTKLKSLRKHFSYIEDIRRYIVHELAHCYQHLKFNAFDETVFYVSPDKSSKYFLLEIFLYSFQNEELEAIMYEALHTWNVERRKRSLSDIFIEFIADELDHEDCSSKDFLNFVDKSGSLTDRITCDYIFNTFIPSSKFAKYFKGVECATNKKFKDIVAKMTDVYKNIYDGFPVPKKYAEGCKNILAFNNLLGSV